MKHRSLLFVVSSLTGIIVASLGLAFGGEIQDAIRDGKVATVESLLKANPALISSTNQYGETPLHIAVYERNREILSLLLANKPDVNAKSITGETPLHNAAKHGYEDMAAPLIAAKADVNAKEALAGLTPLHLAENTNVAAVLLANHADIEAPSAGGDTPLHWAIGSGHKDVIVFLLANKADIKARTRMGETTLHAAVMRNKKEIMELLLTNRVDKVDVNARDKLGRTPLDWALSHKYKDMAALLREHGARQ